MKIVRAENLEMLHHSTGEVNKLSHFRIFTPSNGMYRFDIFDRTVDEMRPLIELATSPFQLEVVLLAYNIDFATATVV